MEAFQASWKEESIDFQKEDFYESIRAPKWIDFTAPESAQEPDDRAWFCIQAGCDQKHDTVFEPTSYHSYLLKFQESKSVNHMSRFSAMENKSRSKARRALLSAPTLKGKDKTSRKVKPYFMSAGKIRQKQCLENENPNSTPENNIAKLDLKMKIDVPDDAEGFSTPKQLSNSADDMEASQNSLPHDFTGTVIDAAAIHSNPKHGKHRITKPMGAFSTPRINKCSVKPTPFRSIQSSKGSNAATSMNSTRSRTTAVKSIVFQTPTKVLAKPPSKDITSLTKVCADLKKLEISGEINYVQGHFCKSSRCAANDPNYSSPASVPTKKYLSARSLLSNQTSETPLSKPHTKWKGDARSSSKPKDSRSVLRQPPLLHRRALFSEQDSENENLAEASAQTLDLVQNESEGQDLVQNESGEEEQVAICDKDQRLKVNDSNREAKDSDSNHEEMGCEDPSQSPEHDERTGSESGETDFFTSAKGNKRGSCDMNSKINCSKGELCQDEGCQSSGKVNSNSLAAQSTQDNGTSVLHVGKHKKPKTTCPKPFRLRTEERGVFKEANLNKKRDESIADKGSLPVFLFPSTSVNKTQHKGKYPHLEPSKPKKAKSEAIIQTKSLKLDKDKTNKVKPNQIETPKSLKLEDNEDVNNALVKTVHQPIKMPFFGQPFKPQRSTKKLTIPREPNFHPIHPKKDCTKGSSDSGHCKKEWID